MGSGKTTVGKILSGKLGFKFIDLDTLIEETTGRKIPEIFNTDGEAKFREYESNALWGLKDKAKVVISTGGGAPVEERNREFFKNYSFTVFLYTPLDEMLKRTLYRKNGGNTRPLLKHPYKEVRALYEERLPVYESLGLRINTANLTPLEVCDRVIELIKLVKP